MAAQTIIERFVQHVAERPDKVALRYKEAGAWKDITWSEYERRVSRAAGALIAHGFGRSDKISLLSNNRPEWHVVDVACMSLGGATAAIYVTSSPEQVGYIVGHSDSKLAFVDTTEQLEKILKMRSELPKLDKVVVFDGCDAAAYPDLVLSWDDFLASGEGIGEEQVANARASIEPGDLATFVYTSGTTGPPKAVMLSHANLWWTCVHSEQHIPIGDTENGRALSYLPLSHIAERMISHLLQIYYGTQTWFAGSLDTLLEDLQACRPTYFFGVPRVWEKFYSGIQSRLESADPDDRKVGMARKAIEVGRKVSELEQDAVARGGKLGDARVPLVLKLQHALLDRLVLSEMRAALGLQECDLAMSAAAPLNPELICFFHSLGIKIAEGYGQSEDNGPTSWNPPDEIKIGTVGTAIAGLEVKLAEDGEILVRGGNVMQGYYKNEEATREVIDEDGWLRSGDIGEMDARGYLKITDRKKDLIITAGGKNIAPQEIENMLKFHPLVSQAVVIGDRRPFLCALVTVDQEAIASWARDQGIGGDLAEVVRHDRTVEEIEAAVQEVNGSLAKVEGIKKFRILDRDFLEQEGEITPTMKVKRQTVNEVFAAVVEDMYHTDSPRAAVAAAPEHK
jgi:long-chain acyl-CoA synthetase